MKVKSESEVTQSYPTPRDPMDCSPPDSSVHGIFQARVLEWVSFALSTGQVFIKKKKTKKNKKPLVTNFKPVKIEKIKPQNSQQDSFERKC